MLLTFVLLPRKIMALLADKLMMLRAGFIVLKIELMIVRAAEMIVILLMMVLKLDDWVI